MKFNQIFTEELYQRHNTFQDNFDIANELKLENLDLTGFDFSGSKLVRASFKGSNLTNADFSSSNLLSANLSGTNLTNARLFNTRLDRANLSNSILDNVKLAFCIGNGKEVLSLQICEYRIVMTQNILAIGSTYKTYDEWEFASDEEKIRLTTTKAFDVYGEYYDIIQQIRKIKFG